MEKWQIECRVFIGRSIGRNIRSIGAAMMIRNGERLGACTYVCNPDRVVAYIRISNHV